MNCARCDVELRVRLLGHEENLCFACAQEWQASPEGKRLVAISKSLVAEWFERERCTSNVEKEAARLAAANTETPTAPEGANGVEKT